ncbi:MAG: heparinase, partial [Gammaproteobacteria bacterium]|nr:heparinase [Gammaproteobacteria bacterium]
GNHLFENAKALVFAGLFFKGEAPKRWLKLGLSILEREIPEQVLKDGGHFELSPMYHVIILEGMLDLYNVCRVYSYPFPAVWKDTISRMRRWLKVMTHPDGEISFFNDAAFKIAVSPQAIETYALRLGLEAVSDPGNGITILKESGYLRLQNENFVVLIDCAKVGPDYLPGHAHADTLSFECSFQGRRMLVNSGTSTYADPILRPWQRSTAAHNTVEVNRENSSEVWGQFRVGHRAKVLLKEIDSNQHVLKVEASHTGYSSQGVLHTRRWICTPTQFVVEDELSGGSGIARFYFHPDFDLHQINHR